MSNNNPAEYLRLLSELDRLEQEQRQLDLRDAQAVEACQRKLELLRKQIAALCGRNGSPLDRGRSAR